MSVRKHIILPEDIYKKVVELNGGTTDDISKTISYLLEKGMDNLKTNENITYNNLMLEKVYSREGYTIDLIEELYKNLDMTNALNNFKKNRFKDDKYVK